MNKKLKNWLIAAATGFLLSLFFHLFIGDFFVYKKKTMLYTINRNSILFISKIGNKFTYGDLLAYEQNSTIYVARCAGFSGDSITLFKAACMNSSKNMERYLKRSFLYEILSAVDLSDSLKNSRFVFNRCLHNGIFSYFTILSLTEANKLSGLKEILEMKRINISIDKKPINIDFSKMFYTSEKSDKEFWLINDYRNNREDSREFGFIKENKIIGRIYVLF